MKECFKFFFLKSGTESESVNKRCCGSEFHSLRGMFEGDIASSNQLLSWLLQSGFLFE